MPVFLFNRSGRRTRRDLARCAAFRLERPLRRRRIFRKHLCGPRRTLDKVSTAIGTHAVELGVRAVATERAFERTDHRVAAVGRQITIAAFATRFDTQNWASPPSVRAPAALPLSSDRY